MRRAKNREMGGKRRHSRIACVSWLRKATGSARTGPVGGRRLAGGPRPGCGRSPGVLEKGRAASSMSWVARRRHCAWRNWMRMSRRRALRFPAFHRRRRLAGSTKHHHSTASNQQQMVIACVRPAGHSVSTLLFSFKSRLHLSQDSCVPSTNTGSSPKPTDSSAHGPVLRPSLATCPGFLLRGPILTIFGGSPYVRYL